MIFCELFKGMNYFYYRSFSSIKDKIVVIDLENHPSFSLIRSYFHHLQANRSCMQSQISKLSAFYSSLSLEVLQDKPEILNGALYFTSLFSKSLSKTTQLSAEQHVDKVEVSVLKVFAQKLLRLNNWSAAERLIEKKFGPTVADFIKFEVLALNGNFRKLQELLPHLAKNGILSERVLFHMHSLLNSRDGREQLEKLDDGEDLVFQYSLLQLALKAKVLSRSPPPLETILRQMDSLSRFTEINPHLLFLTVARCQRSQALQVVSENDDAQYYFERIFSTLSQANLLILAAKLRTVSDCDPEIIALVLKNICKHPLTKTENTDIPSTLLCWILQISPAQFSYKVLLEEFSEIIDSGVAGVALQVHGPCHEEAIDFLEFCLVKNLTVSKAKLAAFIDYSRCNFNFEPSAAFQGLIHSRGYSLSPQFYLKSLTDVTCLDRALEAVYRIPVEQLHGELLIQFLDGCECLLLKYLKTGEIDHIYKLHYVLFSQNRLKSTLSEYLRDNYMHFITTDHELRIKPTVNEKCLVAVFNFISSTKNLVRVTEKFCQVALQSALMQCNFSLAIQIRTYMNNFAYCDNTHKIGGNVLKSWNRDINSSNYKNK